MNPGIKTFVWLLCCGFQLLSRLHDYDYNIFVYDFDWEIVPDESCEQNSLNSELPYVRMHIYIYIYIYVTCYQAVAKNLNLKHYLLGGTIFLL